MKIMGLLGLVFFLLIAFLFSKNRKKVPYLTIISGIGIQFVIVFLMLKTSVGMTIFNAVNRGFILLLDYAKHGTKFVFGPLLDSESIASTIAFQALPLIIFVSALMGALVYLGIVPFIIKNLARIFHRTLKITGVEAFTCSLLIFMGIEAITGVKKYLEKISESGMFTIMTTFMSTIAGSVMAAYVSFGAEAGHLLTASLMSAPAAVVVSKIMIPAVEEKEIATLDKISIKGQERNIIEATAAGTSTGLNLALQVGAMLIAFVSLIYLLNDIIGLSSVTLEDILSYTLYPIAVLIGIPPEEALEVGRLLGIKTIFNEFISYMQLKSHILNQTLSPRAIVITTYALCGFANFGSMAILIGGFGSVIPSRKAEVARLSFKSILSGFLAIMMTAAIVSVFI